MPYGIDGFCPEVLKLKQITYISIMVLAFMVVLAGCGKGESDNTKSNEKIKINTTVFPFEVIC